MLSLDELLHAKQERIDELHRCRPGRTALLVIDMQRGFLEPGAALEVPQAREIIPNLRRLMSTCRAQARARDLHGVRLLDGVPCLRGDPFGPEHLPAAAGQADRLRPSRRAIA